jgi:hypothetical protein
MREAHIPHGETDSCRAWEAIGMRECVPSVSLSSNEVGGEGRGEEALNLFDPLNFIEEAHVHADLPVRCEAASGLSVLPSLRSKRPRRRNDPAFYGERDRPGRSRRRLSDEFRSPATYLYWFGLGERQRLQTRRRNDHLAHAVENHDARSAHSSWRN